MAEFIQILLPGEKLPGSQTGRDVDLVILHTKNIIKETEKEEKQIHHKV